MHNKVMSEGMKLEWLPKRSWQVDQNIIFLSKHCTKFRLRIAPMSVHVH